MSRQFSSNADHLDAATAVRATRPVTISAWVKFGSINTGHVFNIGIGGTSNDRVTLQVAGGPLQSVLRDATTSNTASAAGNAVVGVWTLITGTWTDDTTKACFRDGGNKGTNAVAGTPGAFTATRVSGNLSATPGIPLLAKTRVAHIGVWSVVLSDADVLSLLTLPPSMVQPASLLEYWPLMGGASPEISYGTQATSLTVTGTQVSDDNPILLPYTDGVYSRKYRSIAG